MENLKNWLVTITVLLTTTLAGVGYIIFSDEKTPIPKVFFSQTHISESADTQPTSGPGGTVTIIGGDPDPDAPKPTFSAFQPTISGFGTGSYIQMTINPSKFQIHVGTKPSNTGTIRFPAAPKGWACYCQSDRKASTTTCKQTATTMNSATIVNLSRVAIPWSWDDHEIVNVSCFAY